MVADTKYYDTLGVDPSSSDAEIRKVCTFKYVPVKYVPVRFTNADILSFRRIKNLYVLNLIPEGM